jgi:protein-S-isoprenylcysteine O-methyltransferase Ste14
MARPVLAFFAIASSAAYTALTILGFGGWSTSFAHPGPIALTVLTLVMAVAASFSAGNPREACCGCGRFSCSAVVSVGWVAIQPGHRLATTGICGVIRHPSYLGLLVLSLWWALCFRSGLGLAFVALMVPPPISRIRSEEALLRDYFGSEYEACAARTSRPIPGVY